MKLKKWIAILVCIIMAFSMTGCLGNFYENVAVVNGFEISSGLYLMLQHMAFIEARNLVEDISIDVFDQEVEGRKASDWIADRTEELMRRYVLVRQLSREHNVELDYEAQQSLKEIMMYWDLMSEMYSQNGISQETYERYYTFIELDQMLFKALYRVGSEFVPSEDALKEEYTNEYVHIRFLSAPLSSTEEGAEDVSAEVISAVEDMLPRIESAESLEDLALEDLADIYSITDRSYDPQAVSENISDAYICVEDIRSDVYTPEFLEELKNAKLGDRGIYNTGTIMLIYEKIVMFETDADFKEVRDQVLLDLKSIEYSDYIDEQAAELEIDWVFGARWYFRPSKISR